MQNGETVVKMANGSQLFELLFKFYFTPFIIIVRDPYGSLFK